MKIEQLEFLIEVVKAGSIKQENFYFTTEFESIIA